MQEDKLNQPEDCLTISGFIRLYNANGRFLTESIFLGIEDRKRKYKSMQESYFDKIQQRGYYLTILIN